jgi:probable F420-dependent oxidoreductase
MKPMKLDMILAVRSVAEAAGIAKTAEELGFDGLWSIETQHDPFLPLALATTTTNKINLGTAIALAFPRSPMSLAYTAWDLHAASRGRFILGLGTQVKGHNEQRYSVKWGAPGPKLREIVRALHAIWDCWQTGAPLNFNGAVGFDRCGLYAPIGACGVDRLSPRDCSTTINRTVRRI